MKKAKVTQLIQFHIQQQNVILNCNYHIPMIIKCYTLFGIDTRGNNKRKGNAYLVKRSRQLFTFENTQYLVKIT